MTYPIIEIDPYLNDYAGDIDLRMQTYARVRKNLLGKNPDLTAVSANHQYYGFHQADGGWYYRENAPGADEMYLIGDFNRWDRFTHRLKRSRNGDFEIFLPGKKTLWHGCHVKTLLYHQGRALERIPVYARYVTQDPETQQWCAEIYAPPQRYHWQKRVFHPRGPLLIYEAHIGMAEDKFAVGTYREFTENVLPRIEKLGYTAIQLMAIAEHPYYGSFGYQVSNFFAPSSRFGTPDDLKALIDSAHLRNIAVLLDVVHSHMVKNTCEGICEFDGTDFQFSHHGGRGDHPAWGTRLFDYAKPSVQRFLLSNLRYWLEEFHFDGFRFDGVTSMMYHNHGLGQDFGHYKRYFSMNTDTDAVAYLQLANELVHLINPEAVTIAEDTSAMPGLALPIEDGGIGFDYRMAMGEPDFWIKLLEKKRDEDWDLPALWHELTTRRPREAVVGYAECHDQALVGDKTLMFRLCDEKMYWHMEKDKPDLTVDRGVALHKMIRLLTLSAGGEAYLNFMGNEFGHPEWIDFPRAGNGWSYHYCRRQWHLADDKTLKYAYLNDFDARMIRFAREARLFITAPRQLLLNQADKVIAFLRSGKLFIFNFNTRKSFDGFFIPAPAGAWRPLFSTDDKAFGGLGRYPRQDYNTFADSAGHDGLQIYLPARTAVVLEQTRKKLTVSS